MLTAAYRPEIDGLRAVAVLAVVLFHAGTFVTAGAVGVDVFFVISGYLITGQIAAEYRTQGRLDLVGFYARRVRRLLPALFVVVAVTVGLSSALLSPHDGAPAVAKAGAWSLIFAANFHFQQQTGDYFDADAADMPLLHLWSLGVEEQFYLLWPVLLVSVMSRAPGRLVAILVTLSAMSLVAAEVTIARSLDAAFYQMPMRFWELAAGGLIALSTARTTVAPRHLAMLGLAAVTVACFLPLTHFPGLGAVPAVGGATLLLYAVHVEHARLGWAGALLRTRPLVSIGKLSYSLYLWHWPLLALANASYAEDPPAWLRAAACGLAGLLAAASYHWVETPCRRGIRWAPASSIVWAGTGSSICLAALCAFTAGMLIRAAPPPNLAALTSRDFPPNRFECHYQSIDPLDTLSRPGCVYGTARPARVAIWGDSHALAWQPFAWALADARSTGAVSYTRDSCPPALAYRHNGRPLDDELCMAFNSAVFERLEAYDTVVVGVRWDTAIARDAFAPAFVRTIEHLVKRVNTVYILGPTPTLRAAAPKCIATQMLDACARARADFEAKIRPARQLMDQLVSRHENLRFIDSTDFFCDSAQCPPLRNGYGLYWDSNHVSTRAATAFSRAYMAVLAKE